MAASQVSQAQPPAHSLDPRVMRREQRIAHPQVVVRRAADREGRAFDETQFTLRCAGM
jgi:hypothetical protein